MSTSRSRSDSSADGCSARAANTVCPRPTVEHRLRHVVGGRVLRDEAGRPGGRGRLRRDPAGARDQEHARGRRLAPDRLAQLGARTPRRGRGPRAPRAARSAAPASSASSTVVAVRQRSTQGCSVSSSRKPQCTTSWSSTTSTRRLRSGLIRSSSRTGTTRRTRQSPDAVGPELHDAARPGAPRPPPGAAPSRCRASRRTRAVVAHLEDEGAVERCPTLTSTRVGAACLSALRSASASTDCASGSSSAGTSTPVLPARARAATSL